MSSDDKASLAARRRFHFPYYIDVQTRWLDNDQYGHLNNSSYYLIADSVNNTYLYDHCGVQPFVAETGQHAPTPPSSSSPSSPDAASVVGLVISSSAQFFAQTSFPDALRCGLRVIKLGSSSVTYEIGIFSLPASVPGKRSSSLSVTYAEGKGGSTVATSPALANDAQAAALLRVTHVFVDRNTRRPVKPMPRQIHDGLAQLRVAQFEEGKENVTAKARL